MDEHPDRPDMKPGDVVPPGTPSSGEDVCPDCGGSGRRGDAECETCLGTGRVNEPVGGA
jgi:hypothetical protein